MTTPRAIILANRLVLETGGRISSSAVALIRRTLVSLARVGVKNITIVDGDQADELRERLALHEHPALRVRVVANECWRRASGSALRVVRDVVEEGNCLVLRGDRPLDGETLAALASTNLGEALATVVVAAPPQTDLSNEVKVQLGRSGKRVSMIGLDLPHYDAILSGHALVSPRVLAALEALPNPTLEDGLEQLLGEGERVCALTERAAWLWGVEAPSEMGSEVAAILSAKPHPQYTLMNPGPVNTTARVKSAMVHHDVCHRDAAFSELMVSLTGKLRRIFRGTPQHTVTVITGSGTAAMECAISSTVPRDGKILIIDNGAFGERMVEIAQLHEMDVVHLRYAWGDVVRIEDVERALRANPDIAVVAMIHHETSVGLLNPTREVGALCRTYDALFIVDAVSALGSEDIDVVRDNIDICYASANKCLHAISGAGFMCVAPRVWRKIEGVKPRSYYLDLKRYRRYIEELAQTPFTPAVSTYFALDAACAEFLTEGHSERIARYRRHNERLREGLARLGMVPFTRTGFESHSVVTCGVPEGIAFKELYIALKKRGYIVYGCKDVLADRFLQVANMGDLSLDDIDHFLTVVAEEIVRLRGARVPALGIAHATRAAL